MSPAAFRVSQRQELGICGLYPQIRLDPSNGTLCALRGCMSNPIQTTRVDIRRPLNTRPAWDFEDTKLIVLPNTLEQAAPTRRIALHALEPSGQGTRATAALPLLPAPERAAFYRMAHDVPEFSESTHTQVDALPRGQALPNSFSQGFADPTVVDLTLVDLNVVDANVVDPNVVDPDVVDPDVVELTTADLIEENALETEAQSKSQAHADRAPWTVWKRLLSVGLLTTLLLSVGFYFGLDAGSRGGADLGLLQGLLH